MTDQPALQLDDVHTHYDTSHILQGVSLTIGRGEVVAVLGRNGAGKTTLVRSIIGATRPSAGSIRYHGREIAGWPSWRISRLGIALVPQGRRIFPSLTVRENLELGVRPAQLNAEESHRWSLPRIFETFPILAERQQHRGTALSGGEQQMLACARALLSNPDLLLMDEPSEGLAPQKVGELGAVIERLRGTGLTLLLVEQRLAFALRHADRIYIVAKGMIVHETTPAQLAGDTEAQRRFLGVSPS